MKLSEIKPNVSFKIQRLSNLHPVTKRRLKDMGISEGQCVCVRRYCPFGGPCMIEASGQLIGLRRKDTGYIEGELA
ncbi:ferrous iron transport protein A [Priestia koreensis]|nr:ferrous iron transport protein A [Priestia koreensis]